jgi:ketosteroid isomerase-like protein
VGYEDDWRTDMTDEAVREANMKLVREYIEGINAWDFEAMRALLAEDFVFEQMFAPPGMQSRFEGRESLLEFQKTFVDTIKTENLHDVHLETLHSDPGEIVATYKSDMEFSDPAMEYRNRYICRFTVRDGRITRFQEYFDPVPLIITFGGNVESPFSAPAS